MSRRPRLGAHSTRTPSSIAPIAPVPHRASTARAGLLLLALAPVASAARASNPVTTLADSGPGSLRQAIADALPGDTITFAVTGTIALTSGELVLDKNLVLDGPGASLLAISGSGASRVLTVNAGVSADLLDLTLRDGIAFDQGGAGILNHGDLGLFNCEVSSNQIHALGSVGGGGIANTGTLSLVGCTVQDNVAHIVLEGGGGLHNSGAATLTNTAVVSNSTETTPGGGIFNAPGAMLSLVSSAVSGNSAADVGGGIHNEGVLSVDLSLIASNDAPNDGGGVQNDGTLAMTDTTVSGNSSGNHGGGLYNTGTANMRRTTFSGNSAFYWGGGILNWGSPGTAVATLTNCTLSGNLADLGGGLSNFNDMTLSFTTVTANAFGVENLGPLKAKSSIVAGNLYQDCIEPFTATVGVNLDGDGTCGAGFVQITPAQLQLAGLASYGGPTWTHALLPGSYAIEHASDCSDWFGVPVTTDQRGVRRPLGRNCDVGAFEFVRD